MDNQLLSIQEAARRLKVSTKTLRRWETRGVLIPLRTQGSHRRYTLNQIDSFWEKLSQKKAGQAASQTPIQPFNITESIAKISAQERTLKVERPFELPKLPTPPQLKTALVAGGAASAVIFLIIGIAMLPDLLLGPDARRMNEKIAGLGVKNAEEAGQYGP